MLKFDTRNFPEEKREALAWRAHEYRDFALPRLSAWNYDLCRQHRNGWVEQDFDARGAVTAERTVYDRPKPGCRKCGIRFRKHQRVSIMWLYLKKKALLADTMGPQPLSADVWTPTGPRAMGDLAVGDAVLDPCGEASVVTAIPYEGERQVFRVVFSDGSSTRAADTHLWQVQTPDRKHHGRPPLVLSTEQMRERGLHQGSGNAKFYIPMTAPVEFEEQPVTLDPYTLGVLLGDGKMATGSIMLNSDHDIVSMLRLPEGVTAVLTHQGDADYNGEYRLNGMIEHATALDIRHRAEHKKIPEQYLRNTTAIRLAVLQGLLDTDGTPSNTGVEFGTVSMILAEQVRELVHSLGGTVSTQIKMPTYRHLGELRTGQPFYRQYISLPSDIVPFRLARKAERRVTRTKYEPSRAVVAIEPDGFEQVRCITVSAASHLYLTDNFLVTHNSGKTTSAGGLIAMLLETGELPEVGRVIIVPRAPALNQWRDELLRMIPSLDVRIAEGTRRKRLDLYASDWQVLLIGPEMLRQDTDFEALRHVPLAALICDDIDQLRNPETATSYALDKLGSRADRYVIMTGTPLQKRLPELHAVLDGVGGLHTFGSLTSFTKRYVRTEWVRDHDRSGREFKKQQIVGYQNLDEVKRKMAPLVLRRTADDLDDVDLPAIQPEDIYLDLYPTQRAKYEELRQGVLHIMKEQGTEVKHTTALSRIHYGSAICAGLAALGEPDGPHTSVKLDWVESKLMDGGDLEGEKVVIFANLKNTVRALQARLTARHLGFVTVWGDEPDRAKRHAAQQRFWDDPSCNILIGTRAIEQSLNLQVSRHLINVDMILNPARMAQLAGRVRRDGSAYRTVYVHNLLTYDTQEARYLAMLEREAALAAHIWDENDELFRALDATELLRLITG